MSRRSSTNVPYHRATATLYEFKQRNNTSLISTYLGLCHVLFTCMLLWVIHSQTTTIIITMYTRKHQYRILMVKCLLTETEVISKLLGSSSAQTGIQRLRVRRACNCIYDRATPTQSIQYNVSIFNKHVTLSSFCWRACWFGKFIY